MRGSRRHLALVALCLATIGTAACSGDEAGTKAGGSGAPLTLRIGTHDLKGTPSGDQIEEFARRVKERSGGELRIEPVWRAGSGHDWDQRVARRVMSGEVDMGLIPSRAWDTEGVTSLRALNAPFLITSDELLAEIVSSELATAMLSGLDRAGVVGLALFPEGLRHPFGFEAPLLGPDDYEGESIRTPTSNTTTALFAAFGATVTDDPPNPGTQAGMESSYLLNQTGTATGNVTFYPKANTLVVNDDVVADLDDEEREVLEQAAVQTREWAIGAIPHDHETAEAFCDRGGAVVLAGQADVAALADAAAPVYAELERDRHTKALIREIRAVKSDVGTAATSSPKPCGGSDRGRGVEAVGTGENTAAGSDEATEMDGTYRAELTEDELLDRGLAPQDAYDNSGLIRLTFNSGRLVISEDKERWPDCHGVYSAARTQLSIRITGPGCPYEAEPTTFKWTLDDGALRLVVTGDRAEDRFIRGWWSSEPWTKIE